jgi:rSAM/selenodomain-associated transferase 1
VRRSTSSSANRTLATRLETLSLTQPRETSVMGGSGALVMRDAVRGGDTASVPNCGIAVMAKASLPGRTKTRLVPPLTFEEAADCNTAFLRDVGDNILAAAACSSIAAYVAFGPPQARRFFQDNLPGEIELIDAWHPNFGDCLASAIAQLLQRGHAGAVVINSDSPTLPTSLLIETAEMLALPGDRIVIGPADDGGYYLLGVKAPHPRLFEDIAWSTEHVREQTLERASELSLSVHVLPKWYDVDDVGALKMLQAELFEGKSFALDLRPNHARHTRALIGTLLQNSDFSDRLTGTEFGRAAE